MLARHGRRRQTDDMRIATNAALRGTVHHIASTEYVRRSMDDPTYVASNCSREHLLERYLLAARANNLTPHPAPPFDHFQFGVPTRMQAVAGLLRGYESYWGFDSFLGLPEEQEGRAGGRGWRVGAYSLSCEHRRNRSAFKGHDHLYHGRCDGEAGRAHAVKQVERKLDAGRLRMRIVPGFFNETLTARLARGAHPAWYVDLNADLFVSTRQALAWLFGNNLARPGTLLMYDDWFNTPFLEGESRAHVETARDFGAIFRLLYRCHGRSRSGNLVLFRVEAVSASSAGSDGVVDALKHFRVWR